MKRMNLFQRIWHWFAGHDWKLVANIDIKYIDTGESWTELSDQCTECGKTRRRRR